MTETPAPQEPAKPHVHGPECAMDAEQAERYVTAGRQCFHTLAGGPGHWQEIPEAWIKPENRDTYMFQAMVSPAFGGQSYIQVLRNFGHDVVDKFCNSMEDWAAHNGRPDLLATTNERLAKLDNGDG